MNRTLVLVAGLIAAAPAPAKSAPDPAALADTIDRIIDAKLAERGVSPAPSADDATFFRRIHLALGGRIPLPADARGFLADPDPDKRRKAVEKLLASPAYANYFSALWRDWLIPEAATNPETAQVAPGFEAWVRNRVVGNVPYDRFVTELLIAPLDGRRVTGRGLPKSSDGTNPLAFYTAKEGKPENLAAATARVFLGIQLECAQCHDHPFGKWSRDQFWGMAAFFGGVERNGGALREVSDRREMSIPNTDRTVQPAFLDDTEPEWRFKASPRTTLAAWVTSRDNPFFARAAVNRLWDQLFGVGIVDPVDDFHDKNPPSHPELLDELAAAFVSSGYDAKFILRAICQTRAFQRESAVIDPNQTDVRLFARFPVQGLAAEPLYDSLTIAVGGRSDRAARPAARIVDPSRQQFLELFNPTGRKTESQTTIIQALTLMNGQLVGVASGRGSGRTLGAIVELPGLSAAERIDAIYFAVLSRPPRSEELRRTTAHVEAGPSNKATDRYGDVMWALLNGVEFRTNH